MIDLTLLKPLWGFCKKHATKLLAGLAIGSEATALYLTAKEAPIAKEKVEALGEKATTGERIKAAAPVYIPAGIAALVSVSSIVAETIIGENQKAVLAGAVSVAQATAAKYQQALVKNGGKEKAQDAEREACEEAMKQRPVEQANIYATGKGDQLIFDPLSGRYFTSSWFEVEKAMNVLNRKITLDVWVKVNDWYSLLGLEDIGLGDTSGWNTDHQLDIGSSAQKTRDDRSCLVICYYNRPIRFR